MIMTRFPTFIRYYCNEISPFSTVKEDIQVNTVEHVLKPNFNTYRP